jgi:chromosomal replication initiator protein
MTIQSVQAAVCREFGVTLLELCSRRRGRDVMSARHVGMWLARRATPATLAEIGRAFGDRDRTTVYASVAVVDGLMASNPAWSARVWRLFGSVNSGESVARRRALLRAAA